MRPVIPRLRFLRRRSSPAFTAFCDGVLLLAAAAFFLPSRPWVGILGAVAVTVPGWLRLARSRRCARRVFVPDPLSPDFRAFTEAFAASAAEASAVEDAGRVEWTLCPVVGADGAFMPYAVDINPAGGKIVVGPEGGAVSAKIGTLVRPRVPIPVVVRDAPVSVVLSKTSSKRQVFLEGAGAFRLPWNRRDGNWIGSDAAKLWPAAAFAVGAACPDSSVFVPERLAAVAALLVFATFASMRG